MRTLHAALTTAQQDASRTPYIELVFRSRTRLTTRTYKTTDATNRIMYVQQGEGRDGTTGGGGFIPVEGFPFNISAVIHLQDSDNSLTVLEWKGYRVDIGWGFNTSSGERSITIEGQLVLELYCASLWGLLQARWALDANTDTGISAKFNWQGNQSVRHILMELMAGLSHPLVSAAIEDDGAAYTNKTTAATDTTTTLFPIPAAPAVGDHLYVGF